MKMKKPAPDNDNFSKRASAIANEYQKKSSPDYSDEAEEAVGDKTDKMKNEKKPQKQKVAIAMSEARGKGLKVPPPKK